MDPRTRSRGGSRGGSRSSTPAFEGESLSLIGHARVEDEDTDDEGTHTRSAKTISQEDAETTEMGVVDAAAAEPWGALSVAVVPASEAGLRPISAHSMLR